MTACSTLQGTTAYLSCQRVRFAHKTRPKLKSAVQVVERWIMARLRRMAFASVAEVNRAIAPLLADLNARPFQKLPGSRLCVFAQVDAPAMQALPQQRYEMATFKTVRVHIDYHVQVDHHYHSVPHPLIGQSLDARITKHCVELLHRGQRVAAHERSDRVGGYTTVAPHMPAAHLAHRDWIPQRLIDWGLSIGVQHITNESAPGSIRLPNEQATKAAAKQHDVELDRTKTAHETEQARHHQELESMRAELVAEKKNSQAVAVEPDQMSSELATPQAQVQAAKKDITRVNERLAKSDVDLQQTRRQTAEAREKATKLRGQVEVLQNQTTELMRSLTTRKVPKVQP